MPATLLHFRVGSHEISVHTYGVLLAVALLAGMALARRSLRRLDIPPNDSYLLGFWVICGALPGAWLAGWLVNGGGLVFEGGLVAGIAAGALYCRERGRAFLPIADAVVPAVAAVHALMLALDSSPRRAAAELAVAGALFWLSRRKRFDGLVLAGYILALAAAALTLYLRGHA